MLIHLLFLFPVSANGTVDSGSTNSASAPNTARGALNPASRSRDNSNNVVTSGTSRQRGGRRRPDIDRWPRRRSRRHRLRSRRRYRTTEEDESLSPKGRAKRDAHDNSQYGVEFNAQTQNTEETDKLLTRTRRRSSNENSVDSAAVSSSRISSGKRRSKGGSTQADEADDDSTSVDDVASGRVPPRELAAYVGFYVADARDLSMETHGLLGKVSLTGVS